MKIKTNPLSRKKIENIALNVRKYFNIADDELFPIEQIFEQSEINGLFSIFYCNDLPTNTVSYYDPQLNAFYFNESIFDDIKHGNNRNRFTLCHEFFHFIQAKYLCFNFIETDDDIKPYEDIEWQADNFAGFLLLPTSQLLIYNKDVIIRKFKISQSSYLTRKLIYYKSLDCKKV